MKWEEIQTFVEQMTHIRNKESHVVEIARQEENIEERISKELQ